MSVIPGVMSLREGYDVASTIGTTSIHSYVIKDDHILDVMPNVDSWLLWHDHVHL